MSKTIYFRETDPQTGKAKWIKIDGVKGNNDMIFIDNKKFEVNPFDDNKIFFVYKRTSKKLYFQYDDVKDGERFSFDLSEDEKLRLMTRK